MIKVFIADDENWVIESLKASLDWEHFGYSIIGQANDGFQAYDKIVKLKPDIVLADIRMPGMNGLELIMKTHQLHSGTQFIVISGYAEFAYAQKAMNYGALGYLLKPVDEGELFNLLERAKQSIKGYQSKTQYRFLDLLYSTQKEDLSAAEKILVNEGLVCSADWCLVAMIVVCDKKKPQFSDEPLHIHFPVGTHKDLYILQGKAATEPIDVPALVCLEDASIGFSQPVRSIYELRKAVDDADMAACQSFITGEKGVYFAGSLEMDISAILGSLDHYIAQNDIESIEAGFNAIRECIQQKSCSVYHAFCIYNNIMSLLHDVQPGTEKTYFTCCEELLSSFEDMNEMLFYLEKQIISHIHRQLGCRIETRNRSFEKILQYINQNFNKGITVQGLAGMYYIHPNYLSQLFKKETGEALTEYIARLRIQYACELLKNPDLRICEVGDKAGYSSYFYFARLFKKYTGVTPSQFREDIEDA